MLNYWASETKDFANYRQTDRAIIHLPTETDCTAPGCGWNPISQSAKNAFCLVCDGKGKIQSWTTYNLTCRVMWPAQVQFNYPAPTTGIELGDCNITVFAEYTTILHQVFLNERAYLSVDGKTVRPKTAQPMIIPGIIEEYQYVCYLFTPR